MNKILGIDVGINNLAISLFKDNELIKFNLLKNKKHLKNGEKLCNIEAFIRKILEEEKPDVLVVEGTFWNPRQAKGYSYINMVIGVINKIAWEILKLEPVKLQPSTVKKTLTKNGRASKRDVVEAVKQKFCIEEKIEDHIADAIAVGFSYILLQQGGVKK